MIRFLLQILVNRMLHLLLLKDIVWVINHYVFWRERNFMLNATQGRQDGVEFGSDGTLCVRHANDGEGTSLIGVFRGFVGLVLWRFQGLEDIRISEFVFHGSWFGFSSRVDFPTARRVRPR